MIEYFTRYSETDLPDNMGRWARIAIYIKILELLGLIDWK